LCKKAGASLVYTGLTNPQSRKPINLEDKPAIQLTCNKTTGLKEFIKKNDKNCSLWDFNLGCPSLHAKKSKTGFFMLKNINIIAEILKIIRKNTKKPVTIKIRKADLEDIKPIISIAEKYCDAIAVHPRTQEQGYAGEPDFEFARKIKTITKLPIIYSGNVNSKQDADKILTYFDFVMIGRGAIGNPNIFYELTGKISKDKINFKDYLKLAEKYKLSFQQIKFQAINFTKGIQGASKIRALLSSAKKLEDLKKLEELYMG
jgi:tRNA-dihydrouridine synthase